MFILKLFPVGVLLGYCIFHDNFDTEENNLVPTRIHNTSGKLFFKSLKFKVLLYFNKEISSINKMFLLHILLYIFLGITIEKKVIIGGTFKENITANLRAKFRVKKKNIRANIRAKFRVKR